MKNLLKLEGLSFGVAAGFIPQGGFHFLALNSSLLQLLESVQARRRQRLPLDLE